MLLFTRFGLATGSRAVMPRGVATHRLNFGYNRAIHCNSGPKGAARATGEGRGAGRDAIIVQIGIREATQDWWAFDSVRIESSPLVAKADLSRLSSRVHTYLEDT